MATSNATTLADYASGIGTQGATLEVDATNKRVGISSESPSSTLDVGHIIKMDGDAGIATFQTVSVAGTITYEDVTNVDSVGIVTAGLGVRVTAGGLQVTAGVSTLTGWVSCGDTVALGDAKGIYFGAAEDLSIVHDGSHSVITNTTGRLDLKSNSYVYIESDDRVYIGDVGMNETFAIFKDNDGVELFYNNSKKLETSTAGIVVTGISTADDFTIGVGGTSVHTELGTKASTGKAIAMAMVFG